MAPASRLPLPLRNALAALSIAGLEDVAAAEALAWLAAPAAPPSSAAAARLEALHLIDAGGAVLLPVHAPYTGAVAAHAARALTARAALTSAIASATDPLAHATRRAAALWNEGLFFEVHEVLEAEWKGAAGETRQALQGVIQIAVAYHHHAHGNPRGARRLLVEGRRRLASVPAAALPALDVPALLVETAPWEERLRGGETRPPPRLVLVG